MKRPLSLTARLALLFALVTASLLVLVGLALGRAVEAHFRELDEHELAGKLALVEHLLQGAATPAARAGLPRRLEDAFVGHDLVGLLVWDESGALIHAVHAELFAPAQQGGAPLPPRGGVWQLAGRHFQGREAALTLAGAPPRGVRVLMALDTSHHVVFLEAVRYRLWFGICGVALVAALFGWLVAHRGLAPLRRVAATARGLSADRLGERLAEGDAPAEVAELVEALNGMLARLEAAFQRLSDFSADIAHELRTPVSNLMTQTAVALSQPRGPEEYREVLASNLEEFERIARMVSDMLFLAQAEEGRLPHPGETVALADEARALAEFYEALAEEKGIALTVEGAATVRGDRLMLRRALSNLLSNALRHTPAGGRVAIAIAQGEGQASLAVSNPGETIPPDQLARIFERFHRASPDRHRHGEGAGLGLAITQSIVAAHGGRVTVVSAAGLTTFRITLPQTLSARKA
ncbi:MAG: heavy metal sensor histidine kinase [Rhodocyclaceae bacterium]|jgi:two-component system heavy metal sensor histidine kinase CusS|nr:heavy metal sensor histidine kinase [Rhodocyclaceae bacterium]